LKANEQLDLRPAIGGQVAVIRVELEQDVKAGDILVELNHRDLDAQVAQASASVQSAVATLNKLKSGDRTENVVISEQNLNQAQQQLDDMKNGGRPEEVAQAQTAVDSAKNAVDDAFSNHRQTVNQTELNGETSLENAFLAIESAQFGADQILEQDLSTVYNEQEDYQLYPALKDPSLESQAFSWRRSVEFDLDNWRQSTANLPLHKDALVAALQSSQTDIRDFIDFLDFTGDALQEAVPTGNYSEAQLSGAVATVNIVRSTMKSHLDTMVAQKQSILNTEIQNEKSLDAAQTQIDNAEANYANAQEQFSIIKDGASVEQVAIQQARVIQAEQQLLISKNGARPEDLQLQYASIAQARASLALASANREKAIVRAPIDGTITYLPLDISDNVSNSTIVASLANKSGLEVETFVTENERSFLAIGNTVTINHEYEGVVQQISPALDPVNKKIEVKVTVTSEKTNFTLGETVRMELQKVAPEQSVAKLPLSAVKLQADTAYVFAVNADNQVERINVQIGDVTANKIEVLSAFGQDAKIIEDARGLKVGQEVLIKE
jgi:multidrug resistance efflux pump